MEIQHNEQTLAWQTRVREFVETHLMPWEIEAELNQGIIPEDVSQKMQAHAIELGLSRMDAPEEFGGLGTSKVR